MMASGPTGGVDRDIVSTPSSSEHAFILGALRVASGQFRTQLVVSWSPTEVSSMSEAQRLAAEAVRPDIALTTFDGRRWFDVIVEYAKAQREQSRAVAIYTRVGGPNHPFVAVGLTELARVYREEGLLADALPLLERALAIREKKLGPQHRDVARTLAELASP